MDRSRGPLKTCICVCVLLGQAKMGNTLVLALYQREETRDERPCCTAIVRICGVLVMRRWTETDRPNRDSWMITANTCVDGKIMRPINFWRRDARFGEKFLRLEMCNCCAGAQSGERVPSAIEKGNNLTHLRSTSRCHRCLSKT